MDENSCSEGNPRFRQGVPGSITRVISDVHYRDPVSSVERMSQLAPLLEGADRLIINGDALDTQVITDPLERVTEMREFFAGVVPETTFITGNHDPDISDVHEVSLFDGLVWITHGDVLFADVAPWGRRVKELRRRIKPYAAQYTAAEMELIEIRFKIFRKICLKLPQEHDPDQRGFAARTGRFIHAVFPPNRLLKMLQVWRDLPKIAEKMAVAQRPKARVVITGHTHHAGIWRRPAGHVILNTGCFCPPRGGTVVDLSAGSVVVRSWSKINGELRFGPTLAEFALAPERVSTLSRTR